MIEPTASSLPIIDRRHARRWHELRYCYPVVSRRSGGVSIGINLNPDKACNFDCIYCQVDRTTPPTDRRLDLDVMRAELEQLLEAEAAGRLYEEPPFDRVPPDRRGVRDIAFSGDGEPTTYPQFELAVRIAAEAKSARRLDSARLVLITDACYLTRPNVQAGLRVLDANNGEIWAKLDAGTEAYYRLVNRPNYPLSHVLANLLDAARVRPIVIQSLFMRVHGQPPPAKEIAAYCERLNEIMRGGGRLKLIQVYTIARRTTEPYATPLANAEVDAVAEVVRRRVPTPVERFYGAADT